VPHSLVGVGHFYIKNINKEVEAMKNNPFTNNAFQKTEAKPGKQPMTAKVQKGSDLRTSKK